jgi:hypothetical protein
MRFVFRHARVSVFAGGEDNAMTYASRLTIAAVSFASWALAGAACGSPAPPTPPSQDSAAAVIDVACDEYHGPNSASPEFYRQQYLTLVVKPLERDRTAYASAIKSPDPRQIGEAAARLSDEMNSEMALFKRQPTFGCYDQAVLDKLASTEVAFARTLDEIATAATGVGGSQAGRVPSLVAKVKPQDEAFIKSLNAYASQFGGTQIGQ